MPESLLVGDGVNIRTVAMRVAGLSQPLSDRRDYGHVAGYLDEPAEAKEDRLKDWTTTSDGQDLLFLLGEVRKKATKKDLPQILKHLSNAANEVLLYLQS